MQWLIDELIFSKATIKFIVIGSQILNPTQLEDSCMFYSDKKEDLLKAIQQVNIPGVIFLDCDRHHNVLMKLERQDRYLFFI